MLASMHSLWRSALCRSNRPVVGRDGPAGARARIVCALALSRALERRCRIVAERLRTASGGRQRVWTSRRPAVRRLANPASRRATPTSPRAFSLPPDPPRSARTASPVCLKRRADAAATRSTSLFEHQHSLRAAAAEMRRRQHPCRAAEITASAERGAEHPDFDASPVAPVPQFARRLVCLLGRRAVGHPIARTKRALVRTEPNCRWDQAQRLPHRGGR